MGSRNSLAWQREWSVKFLIRTILSHVRYEIQSLQLKWHMRPLMNPVSVLRGNVLKYQSRESVQAGEQSESPLAVWFRRYQDWEVFKELVLVWSEQFVELFLYLKTRQQSQRNYEDQNLVLTFSPSSGETARPPSMQLQRRLSLVV